MNFTRVGSFAAIAMIGSIVLAGCGVADTTPPNSPDGSHSLSALSGELNGSGASSQSSASEAWVAAFQTAHPAVTINYAPAGSGAGRKAFTSGGVAYAGSDSALSEEELAGNFGACRPGTGAIDLPIYISPIALIFNIDGVEKLNLDSTTIAKIFAGAITKWNDPKIIELNPNITMPSASITAVHRSDDSGTTKNFTDYLSKTAPAVWTAEPSDTFPFDGGEAAQGTSGVVDAVSNGKNTIGYADASRAGSLGVAAIKVGDSFVEYSAAAAAEVVAGSPLAEGRAAGDIVVNLDRMTTDPSHYPLVLVSYLIVCNEYADAKTGALVKAYASYLASTAGQTAAAQAAGAAPLAVALSDKVAAAIATIT